MTSEEVLKTNTTPVQATSNPQANVEQVQPNAINIPLQIQPIIAQPAQTEQVQNLQTNVNSNMQQFQTNQPAPTPMAAQPKVNNYNYDFSNYQGSASNTGFNPIVIDTNSMNTEYKSQYASAINQLANQILNMRFSYNPNEDDLLKQAAKYTTQNTFEGMNAKGILNSSLTAERVTKVVGELIPTYEKMAREEFESNFNMLMNTAQFIMNLDDSQYQKWQNDREMQWAKQEAEYNKKQNAIKNAWERVDELGYVDNEASIILGVPVGTLSKSAREAKEEREYELKVWYEKLEAQQKAEKELLALKNDLEKNMYDYQYQKELEANANATTTISMDTYDEIIKNRFATKDDLSGQYVVTDDNKSSLEQYLSSEVSAGRMTQYDAKILIDKYAVSTEILNYPSTMSDTAKNWINSMRQIEKSKNRTSSAEEVEIGLTTALKSGLLDNKDVKDILIALGYEEG